MKRYLAIFTGSPNAMSQWQSLPEQERHQREAAGLQAWHDWADRHRGSILELGAPLGRTKSVTRSGITDIRNQMTGYTVVEADSHEAAAKLFESHPHFTIFPGDGVEVMECLPIPERPAKH